MNIKKIIAVMLLVFVSTATTVAFYDLYLYNVYIVNRYLRNPSPNPQVQVVTVTIPPGAGSNPRIGFEPAVISIIIGVNNTVVWVNRDSSWHTAHSNIPEFYSNYIQPGGNFTHTFQDPGIYPYHCDPHPWMTGKITVYPATTGNGNAGNVKLTTAHSSAFEAATVNAMVDHLGYDKGRTSPIIAAPFLFFRLLNTSFTSFDTLMTAPQQLASSFYNPLTEQFMFRKLVDTSLPQLAV